MSDHRRHLYPSENATYAGGSWNEYAPEYVSSPGQASYPSSSSYSASPPHGYQIVTGQQQPVSFATAHHLQSASVSGYQTGYPTMNQAAAYPPDGRVASPNRQQQAFSVASHSMSAAQHHQPRPSHNHTHSHSHSHSSPAALSHQSAAYGAQHTMPSAQRSHHQTPIPSPYAPPAPFSPSGNNEQYPASPQRPFSCDMCALSFNRQHDLKRHRDTHSGEKPYLCNGGCGKTFTRKDALKRHQLVKNCGIQEDGH